MPQQRAAPYLTTRWLVVLLIVFNVIAIGLSEVQRRALIERSRDIQMELERNVKLALADIEARLTRAAGGHAVLEQLKSSQAEWVTWASELPAKLDALENRLARLMTWHDSKLDRAAMLFQTTTLRSDRAEYLDDARKRDAMRVYHASLLKIALEDYRREHKTFPALSDRAVDDLSAALVGGGYLAAVPNDPSGEAYRYTTDGATDGQRYGLRITLENGGDCITGVGFERGSWWRSLPPCPF